MLIDKEKLRGMRINYKLGAAIRLLRDECSLSRRALAERANITTSAIVNAELHKNGVSFVLAERIARACHMRVSELIAMAEKL